MLIQSVIILSLSLHCTGYKYLFYNPVSPRASLSHRLFIDKLADLLVDAGHDVVGRICILYCTNILILL